MGTFVNDVYLFVLKQASAEKTAAHNAEVSELKQSLERSEEELGCVKRQLEDRQGMLKHCLALGTNEKVCLLKSICVVCPRGECRI